MTYRPTISSQSDLEATWRHLMTPLGFRDHSVWLMLIDADDRPLPQLTEIGDAADVPDEAQVAQLGTFIGMLVSDVLPGGRVAFLRSRPGSDGVTDADRSFAAALYAATAAAGVPVGGGAPGHRRRHHPAADGRRPAARLGLTPLGSAP